MQNLVGFNAGEWSPKMDARIDLDKYTLACLQLQNFTLLPYGGAVRRAGTQFIAETKDSTKKSRLIPFEFSTEIAYCLEFGDQYIRFYRDGAQLESGGSPYEIASPFMEADLFQIQYVQINDVMYLTHPDHPPQKLIRIGDVSWTIADVEFDSPPFKDENIDTAKTITPSGTTGSITLTASGFTFSSDDVGSSWQLKHLRDADSVELSLASTGMTSNTFKVLGDWNVRTYNFWAGNLMVKRSDDDGITWAVIRDFEGDGDRNVDAVGTEESEVLLMLEFTVDGSYTVPSGGDPGRAVLEAVDAFSAGYAEITAVASGGATATATVKNDFAATTATEYWSEGSWSDVNGYPRAVGIYEQRIIYGGNSNQPQTIYGSVVGDYEDFSRGTNDDQSWQYTIASQQRNEIQWIIGKQYLEIGTTGGEWLASSGDRQEPLTPSNVSIKRQSTYGSKHIQGLVVNDVTLFVQRQGRKVREFVYTLESDGWKAPDMTLLAEHITKAGVVQLAYEQQPDSILWAIVDDGTLCGMTYERDQDVIGWHRHVTDGSFESIAVLYGDGVDERWVIVNRTIGGSTKRFVERVNPTEWTDKEDAFYVDSGLSYNGAAATVFSGLDHLEGKEVDILADGAVRPSQTVISGQITLSSAASVVHIGLGYESILQPMKLDISLGATSQGQIKQIREIVVRYLDSLGMVWSDGEDEYTLSFRDTAHPMDASPPLFSGQKSILTNAPFDYDGTIILKQTQPLPLTILALTIKSETTGN